VLHLLSATLRLRTPHIHPRAGREGVNTEAQIFSRLSSFLGKCLVAPSHVINENDSISTQGISGAAGRCIGPSRGAFGGVGARGAQDDNLIDDNQI
jgi:hypothetical protein